MDVLHALLPCLVNPNVTSRMRCRGRLPLLRWGLCVHALMFFLPLCSVFNLLCHGQLEIFFSCAETLFRASMPGWLVCWLRRSKMFIADVECCFGVGNNWVICQRGRVRRMRRMTM